MSVYISGVGMTRFGKSSSTLVQLLCEAAVDALRGSAVQEIDAIYIALMNPEEFTGESNLASQVAENLGVAGIPAMRVETATSAGAAAVHAAFHAVASGCYRHTLVIGGEKMTHLSTGATTRILAEVIDAEERECGATMPALAAMVTDAYRRKYGFSESDLEEMLCEVAVKNHRNGSRNPCAQFRRAISPAEYFASKIVSSPLRLYDCAPISDGAAAAILTASPTDLVISGIGQATGPVALSARPDLTCFPATQIAAARAYAMAGIAPGEIDFAEVHDAFTSFEVISTEDLGLFPAGKGAEAARDGITSLEGNLPVNPSGGLKARGHPAGASGVAQIVEAARILRGVSPFELKRKPQRALAHSIGGFATNNFVTVIEQKKIKSAKPAKKSRATEARHFHPARPARTAAAIAMQGVIEAFTVLHVTPEPFEPPLGIALIRDKRGARVMAQAKDIGQLKVGRAVNLRKSGSLYECAIIG